MEYFELGFYLLLYSHIYILLSFLQLAKTLVEKLGIGTGRCDRTLELHWQVVDIGSCI